jgi:ABC-type Fe3+ transport system substrate-binding protein
VAAGCKGVPLDWVALDPYFSQANMIMLARYVPHPHAAALFLDWSLSDEGQTIVTSFGRVVARNGVKQRFSELMEKRGRLVDMDLLDPVVAEPLIKEFREIFLRLGKNLTSIGDGRTYPGSDPRS